MLLLGVVQAQASGAGPLVETDFDLLQTEILTASQASVTFSSLGDYATDYQHLQIRYVSRSARTDNANDSLAIQVNADTGSNYARHGLLGYLGSVSSQASTSAARMDIGWQATNSQSADIFGSGVIDILDPFESSKNTTFRGLSGTSGTEPIIILNSGVWLNTTALSSIKLFAGFSGTNLVAESRYSLYGLKASV